MRTDLSAAGFDVGLAGKNVLVVGAGPGIGLQTALTAAGLGARVGVVDLLDERAVQACEALQGEGHAAFVADVTSLEGVRGLGAEVTNKLGPVDVLINVVGIGGPAAPVHQVAVETWDDIVGLNLRQQFLVIREFLGGMVEAKAGAIVAISSINAVDSSPQRAAYGVAKAGLDSLIRTVAIEGAEYGVRANSVRPGATLTPRRQHLGEGDLAELYRREIPLGELGAAQDVANAAIFLASDLASHVTGYHLVVDGGSTIRYSQPAGL